MPEWKKIHRASQLENVHRSIRKGVRNAGYLKAAVRMVEELENWTRNLFVIRASFSFRSNPNSVVYSKERQQWAPFFSLSGKKTRIEQVLSIARSHVCRWHFSFSSILFFASPFCLVAPASRSFFPAFPQPAVVSRLRPPARPLPLPRHPHATWNFKHL